MLIKTRGHARRKLMPGKFCIGVFRESEKSFMSIGHINDVSNGITLRDNIHTAFGHFQLAFVATVST
jgi:hypothetical protein